MNLRVEFQHKSLSAAIINIITQRRQETVTHLFPQASKSLQ